MKTSPWKRSVPDSFAPARKPYGRESLFTQKNGDFGAISATARSCAASISNVESRISHSFSCRHKKLSGGIVLTWPKLKNQACCRQNSHFFSIILQSLTLKDFKEIILEKCLKFGFQLISFNTARLHSLFLYTYKIIVLLAQAAYSYFSAGYRLKNIIVFVMVTLSLMTLLKEGFTNDLNQADYQPSRCD